MNLNPKLSLNLKLGKKNNFSLGPSLFLAFCLILLIAGYMAYSSLYLNLFGVPEELPVGNVVRVNLKSYESTIEYLEGKYDYVPEPYRLPRPNPFE